MGGAVLTRRTHPLGAVLAAFGAISVLDLATLLAGVPPVVLYSGFVVLLLAYSLFRWGSGRAGAAGLMMMSISRSTTTTRVEVASAGVPAALPVAVDAALYRVAQESVTSSLRHAEGATLIAVTLSGGTDEVRLSVTDDGERTGPRGAGRGFGLIGMAERVRLLGGGLDAGPRPGGGWAVHAALPLGSGRRVAGRAPAGRQGEA